MPEALPVFGAGVEKAGADQDRRLRGHVKILRDLEHKFLRFVIFFFYLLTNSYAIVFVKWISPSSYVI